MTLQDLIEKLKRFPIPTISGVVLVACFLAYYFRMDMISQLELKFEEASLQSNLVEDNLVAGTNLDTHLVEMRKLVSDLDERVIRPSELAENLKYFYRLESQTGVAIADLRQNPGTVKTGERSVFAGVGYSLLLSGSFPQVVAYFDELENGNRIYRLNNFNLQRGREANQASVMLALNLELLGWP